MTVWLSAYHVRVPFRAPFETAAGTWTARDSWIVVATDAHGRTGTGEAVPERAEDGPALARLVAGAMHEADAILEAAAVRPRSRSDLAASGQPGRALLAALDAALGDLDGSPVPFAADRGIGVNATLPGGPPDLMAGSARRAVDAGFRTLKLKAGASDGTDRLLGRLRAVRAAVGDGVAIRLDANGTWDLETAVERLTAVADIGLQYVEQPLPPAAIADTATLRRRVPVPVAADEAVTTVEAARRLLEAGAADVLVVKPARVGGRDAVAAIDALAAARGVPVVLSSLFETGIGLAEALACAARISDLPGWPAADRDHGLATADLLEDDLLMDQLRVEAGRMRAPGGPGSGRLGVTLDRSAVARYLVPDA